MNQATILPLVSIVTPVYNGAAYIEELILSVKAQDYPNIEHIIIDDGSQDGGATYDILQRYPHLRWWSRENRGQYATMNEGLERAQGQYVCFISADDLMAPAAVSRAIEWLSAHPEFDGAYGLTAYITENGEPYPIKHPFRRAPLRYYPYFTHIQHCSLYIPRQLLLENKLTFNPSIRFVGDYDWILRIIKSGVRLGFIDLPLSTIRVHENQTSSRNRAVMTKEQIETAKRNGFGGLRFTIYMIILHLANFTIQFKYAVKLNGIIGAKDFLSTWIKVKLMPRILDR